jgi:hypothetical protein
MDALVSVEDFAAYLQRDLDRCTADLALAGASGLVRQYLRWDLSRTTETFVVDTHGSRTVALPTLRLNGVDEVSVVRRPPGTTLPVSTLLAPAEYTWSASGLLWLDTPTPNGFRAVSVVADHGYDPIPDEVRLVVCAIAARAYSNPDGLRSQTVGGVGRGYAAAAEMTALEVGLIAGFRLP